MDFDDTPEEAAFRKEVHDWLSANAKLRSEVGEKRGRGESLSVEEHVKRAKEWQAKKADAGYAQITWPKEWGGRGGTPIESVIYSQEEAKFAVPSGVFEIGLGMCVPTVMAYADPDTCRRFVGPALRGEEIWCQLFSEPAAGSDVAGIRTKAEKDGDEWVINGQKVWTSGAHFSDYGIIVTRTDPSVPKHKGLTMFWIDMKSPGVEVRPIKQISGDANFNEVFFTDVRVPRTQIVGKPGEGWRVANATLTHERGMLGDPNAAKSRLHAIADLMTTETVNGERLIDNPVFRDRLVALQARVYAMQANGLRVTTHQIRRESAGLAGLIVKLMGCDLNHELARLAIDVMGEIGLLYGEESPYLRDFGEWQARYMYDLGLIIGGGTAQIQKNIIAERGLGLPREPRPAKA